MPDTSLTQIIRPLRRGQVTIPTEFRKRLGIGDDTLLQISLRHGVIEITPVVVTRATGQAWARELYRLFADARRDAEGMSEAEVDALIDEAVDDVWSAGR